MKDILTYLGGILFFCFTLFQAGLGFAGIEHHLGFIAAVLALLALFFFKFALPIVIGIFFGARDVLGWHWIGALLLASPGLFVIAPMFLMVAITHLKGLFEESRSRGNTLPEKLHIQEHPKAQPIGYGGSNENSPDNTTLVMALGGGVLLLVAAGILFAVYQSEQRQQRQASYQQQVELKSEEPTTPSATYLTPLTEEKPPELPLLPIPVYQEAYIIVDSAGVFSSAMAINPYHHLPALTRISVQDQAGDKYLSVVADQNGNKVPAYFKKDEVVIGDSAAAYLEISKRNPPTQQPIPTDEPDVYGNFALSHINWSATVISLTGKGTYNAEAQGRVYRSDAQEYCERDPGGSHEDTELGISECVGQVMEDERSAIYHASANCHARTIKTSGYGAFSYIPSPDPIESPWVNAATGERPAGMIGGVGTIEAQYEMLCGEAI